jgi:ATP-dependent DNA helicase RecG
MARLLQGDVGSGKTLAAFFACLRIADWGGQSALLAPTEILSRQHAENAAALLAPTGIRLAYLTGNLKARGRGPLLKALAQGDIDLVIGTHALFSKAVRYNDLQLAIIDEQHRFGVLQRNAIIEKGRKPFAPHLLMMSATPIPRTLALTVFGDLDVSVINQMPAGRLPIKTWLARMGNEQKVYDYVRRELAAGHQAYFVYPRIEEADASEEPATELAFLQRSLKGAEEMFHFLSEQVYPEFPAALIHSKIDEDQQAAILDGFRQGGIKILVATSVVEVGVDNPNATCMIIEHADRFGLSALHQLRGRVGRGSAQSYCFLVYSSNLSEDGKARMNALRKTADGFAIAEEDLRLRGPGEMSGIQQSGYLTLGIADPIRDSELLEMAREDVFGAVISP